MYFKLIEGQYLKNINEYINFNLLIENNFIFLMKIIIIIIIIYFYIYFNFDL